MNPGFLTRKPYQPWSSIPRGLPQGDAHRQQRHPASVLSARQDLGQHRSWTAQGTENLTNHHVFGDWRAGLNSVSGGMSRQGYLLQRQNLSLRANLACRRDGYHLSSGWWCGRCGRGDLQLSGKAGYPGFCVLVEILG